MGSLGSGGCAGVGLVWVLFGTRSLTSCVYEVGIGVTSSLGMLVMYVDVRIVIGKVLVC